MSIKDIIELCFRNLLRRRTRTLLAVTGVIVGTCAIIVMVSIGFGLSQSYQEQISSYGNLHMVTVNTGGEGRMGADSSDKGVINDKTLEKMAEIEGVEAVTPVISEYLVVGLGKKVASAEFVGVNVDVLEKFNMDVSDGRMLKSTDKMGLLFGSQVPYWFYTPGKDDWSDQALDVVTNKLVITGDSEYGSKKTNSEEDKDKVKYEVYEAKGVGLLTESSDDSDYCVYMNIKDMEKIQKEIKKARKEVSLNTGKKTYDTAYVYVGDINYTQKVSDVLKKEMGFETYSPSDWLEQAKDTSNMIQGILGGIGGISLLVAALGITNTMIMSIYERTKEIGVMKVIGANLRDIKRMFLLEAGMIGFLGGAAGVILSFIISLLMNTVLADIMNTALGSIGGGYGATISIIPWWMIFAALAFSTAIGVAAGYHPAKRAMNLSALESLRNE